MHAFICCKQVQWPPTRWLTATACCVSSALKTCVPTGMFFGRHGTASRHSVRILRDRDIRTSPCLVALFLAARCKWHAPAPDRCGKAIHRLVRSSAHMYPSGSVYRTLRVHHLSRRSEGDEAPRTSRQTHSDAVTPDFCPPAALLDGAWLWQVLLLRRLSTDSLSLSPLRRFCTQGQRKLTNVEDLMPLTAYIAKTKHAVLCVLNNRASCGLVSAASTSG